MEEKEYFPIEEVRRIEVEILNHIDKVMTENHIPYYLDGGTLLGAVRHKGFIPWDDDIDLIIPREYYRDSVDALAKAGGPYKVLSRYLDKDYPYLFTKVIDSRTVLIERGLAPKTELGIYVDIFPLDFLPEEENSRKHFLKKIWILRKVAYNSQIWEYHREKIDLRKKTMCISRPPVMN